VGLLAFTIGRLKGNVYCPSKESSPILGRHEIEVRDIHTAPGVFTRG
jgi:hypothetical protein